MNKIKIGEFTLSDVDPSDPHIQGQVWIKKRDGEGGTFQIAELEKVIAKFFEENM